MCEDPAGCGARHESRGGSGACTALRDAVDLSVTIDPVVADRDLIEYGFTAVRAGAANGHRFLGQNPLPA